MTVTDHGYIIRTLTGYIIIMQTGLKKVSKCVSTQSFNAMLDFLFSGGFLHDTCDDTASG